MSAPTGRKRVRRSAHSFVATPFGIICQNDACPCPLVGRLAVVPTARALRYHVEEYFCAESRQDFAAIRRELVADTHQEKARACSNPNSLKDYRKFGSFLRTQLVHFVQMTQTSYNATQTSYNATQTSYNLTSHNIRIHSYIIYIISMSAPNAIMLDARRTYPSAVRPSAERASLRQQISIKRTNCHISEHTKKQMM